jgi:hypothetical protein
MTWLWVGWRRSCVPKYCYGLQYDRLNISKFWKTLEYLKLFRPLPVTCAWALLVKYKFFTPTSLFRSSITHLSLHFLQNWRHACGMACASSFGCFYIPSYQKRNRSWLCAVNCSVLQRRTNTLYDCSLLAVQRTAKLLHVGGGSQNLTRPNIMRTIWGVFVRKSLAVYDMSSKNSCPIRMFCKTVEKKTPSQRNDQNSFSQIWSPSQYGGKRARCPNHGPSLRV